MRNKTIDAFGGYENIGEYKYVDVNKKVSDFIESMIIAGMKEGNIRWDDLLKYCLEFGMIEPPNILTVPDSVIVKCIEELKEKYEKVNKLDNQDTV